MAAVLAQAAGWAGWAGVWLLCAVGMGLSLLTLSGTWLVLLAGVLARLLGPAGGEAFPGWATLAAFAGICVAVEAGEWCSSSWGIAKRGGSGAAGWMSLLGGIAGAVLGGIFIPVFVVGPLAGMLAGSFLGAFWVERRRLRRSGAATRIAMGAVWAQLAVLVLKVAATAGMIAWLAAGVAVF